MESGHKREVGLGTGTEGPGREASVSGRRQVEKNAGELLLEGGLKLKNEKQTQILHKPWFI